jgi:enamine deaminase RidA (YjgF/YER057c/UK114 family)
MSDVSITVTEVGGRQRASTGSKWEPLIGYSRAVRAGSSISVTGTVGANADGSYDPGLAAQTRRALTIIQAAVEALGGRLQDVVRTRMFVTDISRWQEIGAVHAEFFQEIRPATTMVEIRKLIDAAALIEIEADAIVLG